MRIILSQPESDYKTVVETEHFVTIEDAFVGPIIRHNDLNVALFVRDDQFEGNFWRGPAGHMEALPESGHSFILNDTGLYVLSKRF